MTRAPVRGLGLGLAVWACLLVQGCPGELSDREAFFARGAVASDAGEDTSLLDATITGKPDGDNVQGEVDGTAPQQDAAIEIIDDPCAEVPSSFLEPRCGTLGCHAATESGALDLVSPGLAERLIGQSGTGACSTELFIDAAQPAQSLIYRKLLATPPCGVRMPLLAAPEDMATDEEQACVLAWINALVEESDGKSSMGTDAAVADAATQDAARQDATSTQGPFDPAPLPRAGWALTSSTTAQGLPLSNALDGDPMTRWSNGVLMAGGEWLEVDLGTDYRVGNVLLDSQVTPTDSLAGYRLWAGTEPDDLGDGMPLAQGDGTEGVTRIEIEPTTARYIRIEQTGTKDSWWSIHELNIEGEVLP